MLYEVITHKVEVLRVVEVGFDTFDIVAYDDTGLKTCHCFDDGDKGSAGLVKIGCPVTLCMGKNHLNVTLGFKLGRISVIISHGIYHFEPQGLF